GIALQARQDLNARTPWQVQVEEDEVRVGRMSGPLLLLRSQQVIEGGLSVAQQDEGIGEVRPSQIALDQTRMARIVFHHNERGGVVFEHASLLSPINERSGAPSIAQRAPNAIYAIDARRMPTPRTRAQEAAGAAAGQAGTSVVTGCHRRGGGKRTESQTHAPPASAHRGARC